MLSFFFFKFFLVFLLWSQQLSGCQGSCSVLSMLVSLLREGDKDLKILCSRHWVSQPGVSVCVWAPWHVLIHGREGNMLAVPSLWLHYLSWRTEQNHRTGVEILLSLVSLLHDRDKVESVWFVTEVTQSGAWAGISATESTHQWGAEESSAEELLTQVQAGWANQKNKTKQTKLRNTKKA